MRRSSYSPEAIAAISNGCSGGVTWFYRRFLGRDIGCRYCCDEHDVAYAEAVWNRPQDKFRADWRFLRCIWRSGRRVRAVVFWLAVTLGGWWAWARCCWEAAKGN